MRKSMTLFRIIHRDLLILIPSFYVKLFASVGRYLLTYAAVTKMSLNIHFEFIFIIKYLPIYLFPETS